MCVCCGAKERADREILFKTANTNFHRAAVPRPCILALVRKSVKKGCLKICKNVQHCIRQVQMFRERKQLNVAKDFTALLQFVLIYVTSQRILKHHLHTNYESFAKPLIELTQKGISSASPATFLGGIFLMSLLISHQHNGDLDKESAMGISCTEARYAKCGSRAQIPNHSCLSSIKNTRS